MPTDICGASPLCFDIFWKISLFHFWGFIFVSGPCDSVIHWASDFIDFFHFSN